jgi:hypothetical protein
VHLPSHGVRQRLFQDPAHVVDGPRGKTSTAVPAARLERLCVGRRDSWSGLSNGVHPKVAQEPLGHSSVG